MAHHSTVRLLALHALRLKGIAEADAVAALMDVDADVIEAELDQLEAGDLVAYRHGRIPGYTLTPEGKVHADRLVREELDASGSRSAVEAAYADFLTCNDELLAVCTAWQLREVDGEPQINDHADAAYDDSVRDRLAAVHATVAPVLERLGTVLERFAGHQSRLRTALDRVLAGDHDYFTKPMFPSYHSNWFELHEDLLATLGTERHSGGNC